MRARWFWTLAAAALASCADAPPATAPPTLTGASCEDDAACGEGGLCLITGLLSHCATRCDADAGCASADACVRDELAPGGWCMRRCDHDEGCDSGTACVNTQGASVCAPPLAGEIAPVAWDELASAIDLRCDARPIAPDHEGPRWELDLTLDDRAALVSLLTREATVQALSLRGPGAPLSLTDTFRHHNTRALELDAPVTPPEQPLGPMAFDWTLMIPHSPAMRARLTPGDYTLIARGEEAPCVSVARASVDPGPRVIHLNLIDLTDGESALWHDPTLRQALRRTSALLATAGITLGRVRWQHTDAQTRRRFAVLRDADDLREVTSLGRLWGLDADQRGVIHVALVEDLTGDLGGLAGYAANLPGGVGLQGVPHQGLVMSMSALSDASTLGQTLAHELGHWLGLRHTTELLRGSTSPEAARLDQRVGLTDPLSDTPDCDNPSLNLTRCPDRDNLMFPTMLPGVINLSLTAQQIEALRGHPAVRPAP